jgi:hypothetical protein
MNAANVTHGLKALGLGSRMWVGVLVLMTLAYLLGDPKNRQRVIDGLFA